MRKDFIIKVLLSFIILSIGFVNATCNDSDGGLNYNIRGEVYGLEIEDVYDTFTDHCGVICGQDESLTCGEDVLAEYSCNENGFVEKVLYQCPDGCDYGACGEADEYNITQEDGTVVMMRNGVEIGSTAFMMIGYCVGEIPCSVFTSKIECDYAVDSITNLEKEKDLGTFFSRYGLCQWDGQSQKCVGKTSCMSLNALTEDPTEYNGEEIESLCNKYRENYDCEWETIRAKTFYEKVINFFKELFSFFNK